LFFPAGASKRYVHDVHFEAWKTECKGLYYLRTETSNRAENVSEKVKLEKLKDYKQEEDNSCLACEG
jgi:ribonucleoside-diphosphate reductase alpha chain